MVRDAYITGVERVATVIPDPVEHFSAIGVVSHPHKGVLAMKVVIEGEAAVLNNQAQADGVAVDCNVVVLECTAPHLDEAVRVSKQSSRSRCCRVVKALDTYTRELSGGCGTNSIPSIEDA